MQKATLVQHLETQLRKSVLQAFLPQLGTDMSLTGRPGRIVNITSVGGKYGAPFMSAYSASKHAVEGLSDSLRRELIPYGIDVIVVGGSPSSIRNPMLYCFWVLGWIAIEKN
jgi:NAD(P)-dependent dehydrogenase (short-subunit alcohol dehydrogenase family)